MNRNYKVIWNASLNCFMAVAEYAKARGKSSKSSVSSNATINTTSSLSTVNTLRLSAIILGMLAAGFGLQANAELTYSTSGTSNHHDGTYTHSHGSHGTHTHVDGNNSHNNNSNPSNPVDPIVLKFEGDDTLTVRLAKDINLGETGSVTTGNTQVNNAGITLYRGDNGQVVLTKNGLNNGGNQITNVLSGGETLTNAANIGDVKGAVSDIATKGLDFAGNLGDDIHKDLGQKLEIVGTLDASKTASAKNIRTVANNGKLEVQLADALDVTSVTTGNAFMNNNGFAFVGNEPGRTVILSSSGLDNGGNIIRNVGTGLLNSDAVNVGQLREVTIALDQGWGITAQGDIATMVKKGGSVDMNSRDGNIKVSRTLISNAAALDSGTGLRAAAIPAGANDLSFDLNPDLTVDSLTTGDTTINSNGLTIAGGPSVTKSGIDAADKKNR